MVHPILKGYTSVRNPPVNLKPIDLQLFEHEYKRNIEAATILTMHHVLILKDTIFKPFPPSFFSRFTHIHPLSVLSKVKRCGLAFLRKKHTAHGLWIADEWSGGYFHWFGDAVPRLVSFELANPGIKPKVLLPASFQNCEYISESLAMLNFEYEYVETFRPLRVSKLEIPGHLAPTGNYYGKVMESIRDKFLPKNILPPSKKVYISRAKAKKRKILNEMEIIKVFEKSGFEIFFMEDLSFSSQLDLLSKTKILAGVHGAGLTNMLFMPKGGKILELRISGDYKNNCYFSMASDLGHQYFYLLNPSKSDNKHLTDITVDPLNLDSLLKKHF